MIKLYHSSAQGMRAGNLLLCTVKLRHKSLRIHVYFAQRQREMATGKKVERGREERRAFPPPPVLLR